MPSCCGLICVDLINIDADHFFVYYIQKLAGPEPEDGPYSDWWLDKWMTSAGVVVSLRCHGKI